MAFSKPSRFVDRVFLHCSASDNASHDNVATMRRWHTDPKPAGRGWSDVGYHYFIRKDGTLENGRPINRTPAAQAGHNTGSIAICCHGLKEAKFTDAQFDTLRALCLEINEAYNGKVTFHGHREVAAKACPVFDYKNVLKLDRFGQLGLTGAAAPVLAVDTETAPEKKRVLRRGDRGPAVAELQSLIFLKDDGIFGPKTERAVRDFQEDKGLTKDGVVGPQTWKALIENDRIVPSGEL